MSEMPNVGEQAPDFQLSDDQGEMHRLSDRRGHYTVVYFYPEDDTPGCTTEACSFRDAHAQFGTRDAEVWGISPQGRGSKAAFRAKYGLPFTLLADEDHAVADAYGAWVEKNKFGRTYWGVQRCSFLVDPAGRVVRAWPKVTPEGHANQVLAALEEAQSAGASA